MYQEWPRQTKPKKGQFMNFSRAFRNKCSVWIELVFLRKKHQNSQEWAKFMNLSFWPFLWFGLPGRLLTCSGIHDRKKCSGNLFGKHFSADSTAVYLPFILQYFLAPWALRRVKLLTKQSLYHSTPPMCVAAHPVHQVLGFFCDCDCDFLTQVKKSQQLFGPQKGFSSHKALRFFLRRKVAYFCNFSRKKAPHCGFAGGGDVCDRKPRRFAIAIFGALSLRPNHQYCWKSIGGWGSQWHWLGDSESRIGRFRIVKLQARG